LKELVGPRQRGMVFGLERDGAMFHLVGLTPEVSRTGVRSTEGTHK
jgi:hypothetical protein